MELTSTARVILGMLAVQPMSGYQIKQVADISVRHFWNVSYGQIYPELRTLTEAGLVQPRDSSRGSRQRQTYTLTGPGREELMAWLGSAERMGCEIRDGMLLKIFFSDSLPLARRLALLDAMRNRHEETVATLEAVEPYVREHPDEPMKAAVLDFGIGLHRWCADWCADLAARLESKRNREEEA